MKKKISEKLKKLVALAKGGVDGEKENAIRFVKTLCKKHNLEFDDVMEIGSEVKEYKYEYRGIVPISLAAQIAYCIMSLDELQSNRYYIFYKTTEEKHQEFLAAMAQYIIAYKKERKALTSRHRKENKLFPNAFIQRHKIFSPDGGKNDPRDLTDKDIEEIRMAVRMAGDMEEEVSIYKQIGAKQ